MPVTAERNQSKDDWWGKQAPGQVQVGDDEEVAMELKRRWVPESRFKKITINKEKGTPVWPTFPCTMYLLSRSSIYCEMGGKNQKHWGLEAKKWFPSLEHKAFSVRGPSIPAALEVHRNTTPGRACAASSRSCSCDTLGLASAPTCPQGVSSCLQEPSLLWQAGSDAGT